MSRGRRLRDFFVYRPPDPIGFWRPRAGEAGWLSVMWSNPAYNELAHRDQWRAIERNLPPSRGAVLDLGCGTGRLTGPLAALFERYVGVDLDTMIAEARRRNPDVRAEFNTATAQAYDYPESTFDLVLSMACLASACRAEELDDVARRIVAATRPGGHIILVDPFHRLPLLTRTCRLLPREVIAIFRGHGATLREWGGVHFAPTRVLLARRQFARFPRLSRAGYRGGECVLRLARRRCADYSVLAFQKPQALPDQPDIARAPLGNPGDHR